MSESRQQTIERLDEELAGLYRDGGFEAQRIKMLHARIDRLEAEQVRAQVLSDEGIEHE